MGRLSLPIHSYEFAAKSAGAMRLLNCYAEKAPPEGKAPTSLVRSPGVVSASAPLAGTGRGLYRFKNALYAVAGTTLYRIDSDHAITSIGTVTGVELCTFADNPTQLAICDPTATFVYDGALTKITSTDFNRGFMCAPIDNYVVFLSPDGKLFCSNLADARTYDPLNYATPEGSPDDAVGLIADHRQIVIGSTNSLELFENLGGSGFPFQRASNGFIELGCAAGYSLAKVDNSVFWLASDLTVRRLVGLTPARVSQHGVEEAISTYAKVDDARAFGVSIKGHLWYVLTFPTASATWLYDASTGEWHERASYGLSRWRACASAVCYNKTYVQDYETGKVGYLDGSSAAEWGEVQRMQWTYGSVYDEGNLKFHSDLTVKVQPGVGLVSGQGADPQISLEVSDDGGMTFDHVETQSLGAMGQYKETINWQQLGMAEDRVYRNTISDPVMVRVSDAQLTVS